MYLKYDEKNYLIMEGDCENNIFAGFKYSYTGLLGSSKMNEALNNVPI
jgi:hypothetical protein